MANSQNKDHSMHAVDSISCKCSKSDEKMNKQSGSPFLENAVSKIAERRDDLTSRQQYLKEKIATMEKSIPALMAINMWKAGKKCDEAPWCKIQKMMRNISPQSDPTEKLVENLKDTVKNLNTETAQLHDKIIAADIKLEESRMELESVELENKEFDERLKQLEEEVLKKKSPSLHSIHSEDLVCLARIRQLAEEEICLKSSIKELEDRETAFQEQIKRIVTAREFQKSMCVDQCKEKKNINQLQPTTSKENSPDERLGKKIETLTERKKEHNGTFKQNFKNEVVRCWDKPSRQTVNRKCALPKSFQKNASSRNCTSSTKSCCSALTTKSASSRVCPLCSKSLANSVKRKSFASSSVQCKNCQAKGRKCASGKNSFGKMGFPGSKCKKCHGWIPSGDQSHPRNSQCPCTCRAKCANFDSQEPCDCSEYLRDIFGDEVKPETAKSKVYSSTDDEYSDCCDCGCDDTELSSDSCEC